MSLALLSELKPAKLNLRLATLKVAYAELEAGVREKSDNWSPRIKEYLNEADVKDPAPWCAGFVNWCAKQAANSMNVLSPLEDVPVEAYVQSYYQYASGHNWVVQPKDVKPGMLFAIWFPSLKRYAHIGFVYEVDPNLKWFTTIEGNSNDDGSREGIEVCSNKRNIKPTVVFMHWTQKVNPK
jgi:hypothetical protein